jgi:hypothetical protein
MNRLIRFEKATPLLLVTLVLTCFGVLPRTHAVVPLPDGCYPNYTTAEGCNALYFLTTGPGNTALGWYSLFSDTTGSFNTGVGGGALALNNGDSNTAVGAAALLLNTTGTLNTAVGTDALVHNDSGGQNTANGAFALFSNTTGIANTANGYSALFGNTTGGANTAIGNAALSSNTTGFDNTATGFGALKSNTTGGANTAEGRYALRENTTGGSNTANGVAALKNNTTGFDNTAIGFKALSSNATANDNTAIGQQALMSGTTGIENTAVGSDALHNNASGDLNTALGFAAGSQITGDRNVCIGAGAAGVAGVNFTTWIDNVYSSSATARQVYVNSDNKIGTLSSSRRYKDEIRPMGKASEAILSLRPVSFRYKKAVDPTRSLSFGLIAEEVAEVDPDLITPDQDGKPQTVRYEAVNAMLLNEFLKAHRKVEQLEKEVAALTAGLQKMSAQIEMLKPAPKIALDIP